MERYSKGRLKLLEEGLQAQIAEFKADFSDKAIHDVAKLGRLVRDDLLIVRDKMEKISHYKLFHTINLCLPF